MSTKKKSIVSVRLSKTSSARPILNSSHRNTEKQNVEEIAKIFNEDDRRSQETTHGKLPVEAAYIIMKRVTMAAGLPVKPVGMSTFNKLQSLRTEPALKLLLNDSWHNFFVKQEKERKEKSPSKRTLGGATTHNSSQNLNALTSHGHVNNSDGNTIRNKTSTSQLRKQQTEVPDEIQSIFCNLCSRVEELWSKLRLRKADQYFYRKSLLRGPAESLEQCREIANYIEMLQLHQSTTIAVLESIKTREANVSKCYTLLLSIADKYDTQMQLQQSAQREQTSSRPTSSSRHRELSGIRAKFEHIANRQYQHSHSLENNMYWKEELLLLLDVIRCDTLEVIKNIQAWRQWLYRPLPFIWNGVNYIEKMKYDMSLIESDNYLKILACIPLRYEDLQCIVFFPPEQMTTDSDTPAVDTTQNQSIMHPSHPQSEDSEPHVDDVTPPPNAPVPSTAVIQNDEYITAILHEFNSNIDKRELYSAAKVVLEEVTVQEAIEIEVQSLLNRGVFIPTLKLSSKSMQNTTGNTMHNSLQRSATLPTQHTNGMHSHGTEGREGVAMRPQSGRKKDKEKSHLNWLEQQEKQQLESSNNNNNYEETKRTGGEEE